MILSPNRAHFGGSCAGTPRELFVAFFGIIAQTLRDIVGADWSDEIDAASSKVSLQRSELAGTQTPQAH
jgi:hypothetical protein